MSAIHTHRLARLTLALISCLTLASCGGGGGGGGSSSSGGGSSSSSGGGNGRGAFTLGATSASFKALQYGTAPAEARIAMTITGTGVAAVGAAIAGPTAPTWLQVSIEGANPNFTLVLRAIDTQLAPAHYESRLTVGTADQAGNVLTTREVQINYDVIIGLTLTATPIDNAFVFGSSRTTSQVTVNVAAGIAGKSWTIASNQPWLPVPAAAQQGDGNLTLTLNGAATGVAPGGTATAQLVVQNTAEPIDQKVINIRATMIAPQPLVSSNSVVLGGPTGLARLSQQLEVSLDTGTNAYPWTLTFDTPQSNGWIVSDVVSGNISATQHSTVTLGVGSPIGALGNYSGTAIFESVVAGQAFRTSVPVTLKWHGQRLVPDQAGVAFSSFPSRLQPTARTMRIRGSRGINNVPWTATSNRNWLSVTPAGTTGGNLTLTANPAGLAANTLHIAQVTLASTSANIERNETIRVGLWIGSTNPANLDVSLPTFPWSLVVNPVEPYAYSIYNGEIHVHHVYTGAEIASFQGDYQNITGETGYPISMDVSSDGSTLYVANGLTARVIALNAATGNVLTTWQLTNRFGSPLDSPVVYARTNGYPILWTPFGDSTVVLDLDAGVPLQLTQGGSMLFRGFETVRTPTPDGSRLFTIDSGSTSETVSQFTTVFGVFGGRTLEINEAANFFTFGGPFTRQMCVSASGTRLYTHNQSALQEISISVEPPQHFREIHHPLDTSVAAIDCNWNGRTYVGISAYSAPQNNVLVLDAAGESAGSFQNGPLQSFKYIRQMGLTGDSRRIASIHGVSGNPQPQAFLSLYNVPP